MIKLRDLEVKILSKAEVEDKKNQGLLKPVEFNLLDPMATKEELEALGVSILKSNGTNEAQPIVVQNWFIVDGKNRLQAMDNVVAKKYYFAIIPNEVKKEDVEQFIMQMQTRRDKTKTQKAIAAYKHYKLKVIESMDSVARKFGVTRKAVQACKLLDLAGMTDVLDTLHAGGSYRYEAVNQVTGEVIVKQTTSIQVVERIIRGKQKNQEMQDKPKEFIESDCVSKDTNVELMKAISSLSSLDYGALEKLVDAAQEAMKTKDNAKGA